MNLLPRILQKKRDRERGQSLPELALSLVMLLMLVLGAYDFGRAFYTWIALRDAAQEGASYGSITCPACGAEVVSRAQSTAYGPSVFIGGLADSITVSCAMPNGCNPGDPIIVTATYPNFTITTPFLGWILGTQSIPIRATIEDYLLVRGCPYP